MELDAHNFRVGIVSAHARADVVGPLVTGTTNALVDGGVARGDIAYLHVARPFDLALAAQMLMRQEHQQLDGVICVGLIVRDTLKDMFDFESKAVAQGIMKLNLKGDVPVVYGVLACASEEQAKTFLGENGGVSADHGFEWAKALVDLIRTNRALSRPHVV
ncbi:hypothetical protein ATCC90586_006372 [Pythium insidiosum]|nr:hypothetical protein ATCC90586_006372 [Pythium insidiosum]